MPSFDHLDCAITWCQECFSLRLISKMSPLYRAWSIVIVDILLAKWASDYSKGPSFLQCLSAVLNNHKRGSWSWHSVRLRLLHCWPIIVRKLHWIMLHHLYYVGLYKVWQGLALGHAGDVISTVFLHIRGVCSSVCNKAQCCLPAT